jgi:hypothetical protein
LGGGGGGEARMKTSEAEKNVRGAGDEGEIQR